MTYPFTRNNHTFHIPVMGTAFTIDTPLKIARYGISSVVSLVDDVLTEQMRKYYCEKDGEPYEAIGADEDDARARRITAYLNYLNRKVAEQVKTLQATPFEEGSEITRYYELLPETQLKQTYRDMLACTDPSEKNRMQEQLRKSAIPGTIDANIMTKVDRNNYKGGTKLPVEFCDAMAALRGYAMSDLRSSIVFSAGMNPRLYSYAAQFDDFLPGPDGTHKKGITLKVSDYRSAEIQGRFLAKRGLWVSEYRIESGLNCGGHAFATKGYLLGPILEELKQNRERLVEKLHPVYNAALQKLGRPAAEEPNEILITVQGGIGTSNEHDLLLNHYRADRTGWATPFLLVPEIVNVDDEHRAKLQAAENGDVYLSNSSPFGIPFWNLRTSGSEIARRERVAEGKPGSHCPKGYLMLINTEFTERPLCTASRAYQSRKLKELPKEDLTTEQRAVVEERALAKSCICHDLAGGVTRQKGIDSEAKSAICCGPNIVNFSKLATLEQMVDHIYGRINLLTENGRPHMFVRELRLYIDYLRQAIGDSKLGISESPASYFEDFKANLSRGIEHYRRLADEFTDEQRGRFLDDLAALRQRLSGISLPTAPAVAVAASSEG